MDAAEALDRHDLSGLQGLAGKLDRVAGDAVSVRVQIEDLRPADRAAVRLGVIAAVLNVVVLPVAVRAHGEGAHGGLRPVVGDILDDGKARAAVGAVDERIAVAPVRGIQQLAQAVVTDADIRGNEGVAQRLALTRQDLEIRKVLELFGIACLDLLDHGELRRVFGQLGDKALERPPLPFQLQLHAGGGVPYVSPQPTLPHIFVDKGPETDALHDAANMYQGAYQLFTVPSV